MLEESISHQLSRQAKSPAGGAPGVLVSPPGVLEESISHPVPVDVSKVFHAWDMFLLFFVIYIWLFVVLFINI